MSPRIVVFGATGYTGGLVAEALVRRGLRPVLAARSRHKLASVAERYDGIVDDIAQDRDLRAHLAVRAAEVG